MIRVIAAVAAAMSAIELVKYFSDRKIFISFAIEDQNLRNLFVGQAGNTITPFEFADRSVKKPWDSAWKTKCRTRIKSCDGVVVLFSENTLLASGVHWEVKCAIEEQIPILVIYSGRRVGRKRLPSVFEGLELHKWSWPAVEEFVAGL